jgi:hypothetical protein
MPSPSLCCNQSTQMLSKISWSGFIWFLIFLLVLYYFVVVAVYFRKEVLNFMRKPVNVPQTLAAVSTHDDISFSAIHDLLEDLKKVFAVATKTMMVKEELLQAVRVKLKLYPGLKGSDLREDISNHIRIEAKNICEIVLDDTDLKQLWNP